VYYQIHTFKHFYFSLFRAVQHRNRWATKPQTPRKQRLPWEVVEYKDGSMDRTKNSAKCNLCPASLQAPDSTPEPLKRHLKAHHPLEYAIWAKKQQEVKVADLEAKKVAGDSDATVNNFKTPSIAVYLRKTPYPIHSSKQETLDLEVATMIVISNLPFAICNNMWFKWFCNALDSRFTVESRTTIGNKQVRILFNNVMETVKKNLDADLKYVTGMGLVTDT
jgi:hypothetical protein